MMTMNKENVKIIETFAPRQQYHCECLVQIDKDIWHVIQTNKRDKGNKHFYVPQLFTMAIKDFLDAPYIHSFQDIQNNEYRKYLGVHKAANIYFRVKHTEEEAIKLFERFVEYVEHIPNINMMHRNAKPMNAMLRIVISTYVTKHLVLIEEDAPSDTQPQKYIPIEVKNIIKNLRTCTKCSGLYLQTDSAPVKILLLKSIKEILQDSINNIDNLMNRINNTIDILKW